MSHTRLRAKAELYAAYVASDAWRTRHPYLPALLFLTTTDIRARKFLKALARSLSHGPRSNTRRAFVAAAAGIVWAPRHLLSESCFADLDGHTGLTLPHILNTARAPYEQALAHQRERQAASEERLRVLRDDPSAMREHLRRGEHRLGSYLQALEPAALQAIKLLLASNATPPRPQERAVLRTIARDLGEALLELQPYTGDPPEPSVIGEVALLVEDYRASQAEQVKALIARHGDGPTLRRAETLLHNGELLDPSPFDGLERDAEHDVDGRREQHERRTVYLVWREQAARQLARKAGPLGRLTHPPTDFYPQLDREHLKICGRCQETIYPRARRDGGYGSPPPPSCPLLPPSARRQSMRPNPYRQRRKRGVPVSTPEEQPNTDPRACPTPGRRRATSARTSTRSLPARSRDVCTARQRLLDPEHEAFVDWFVAYWRRRGAQLFASHATETEA
jgi:hypothetical protein